MSDFPSSDSGTFAWQLADTAVVSASQVHAEVIADFNPAAPAAGGDVLDLRDVLAPGQGGESVQLDHFLDFDTTTSVGSTIVRISATGGFGEQASELPQETQRIVLEGVDLRLAMGLDTHASDTQVIERLLSSGKLIVDL